MAVSMRLPPVGTCRTHELGRDGVGAHLLEQEWKGNVFSHRDGSE